VIIWGYGMNRTMDSRTRSRVAEKQAYWHAGGIDLDAPYRYSPKETEDNIPRAMTERARQVARFSL